MSQTLLLIYGGQSAEHDISCKSAFTIYSQLIGQYSVWLMAIEKNGSWHFSPSANIIDIAKYDDDSLPVNADWPGGSFINSGNRIRLDSDAFISFDLAFPILHGPFGEDGRIQGMFEILGVIYTGSNMYASALCIEAFWFLDCNRNSGPGRARQAPANDRSHA